MDFNYNWLYVVDPTVDEPCLLINKHIGTDSINGDGIIGDIFEREISQLDLMGKKKINIYINSHGGSVTDGFSIFNSILRCKTPTCGYVSGLAASIAGVILQACKERNIYDYGILMVHNPLISGQDIDVDEDPVLSIMKQSLVTMLSTNTKLSKDAISLLMNKETWMDCELALKNGFVDNIIKTNELVDITAEYLINNKIEINNSVKKFDLILNKIITKEKIEKTMIEKLLEVLKLDAKATELEIKNAAFTFFPFLENKVDEIQITPELKNEDTSEDEDCMNEKKDEVMDYKKMYDSLKMEMDEMKNSKIVEFLNEAEKAGKIVNSEIENWKNFAKIDFEGVKKIINGLSTSKVAPKLTDIIDKEASERQLADIKNETELKIKNAVKNEVVGKTWDEINLNSLFNKFDKK